MARTYRPYAPEQALLLPPSLRDWLSDDHLAYFVSDLVDQFDLSATTLVYEGDERGQPPYHPVMMTKVLVYAYCVGVFSSRTIDRRLSEDVAFRVLAAGNQPDFRTISDFRKQHLPALPLRASPAAGVGSGRDDARARRAGQYEGEGQRVQAQGDVLRPDARQGTATEGGGGTPALASRGDGCRGRSPSGFHAARR
jgi:transposase